MQRVTLRVPERQVEEVERMVEDGYFPNRSEAIRTAIRDMLEEHDYGQDNDSPWRKLR